MNEYCIGIDLGGTAAKIGIFEITGRLVEKWQIPTNLIEGGKYILTDIAESIKQHIDLLRIEFASVTGVGIGIPGIVLKNGIVAASVNLGWNNKDVINELEQLLKLPVRVLNDANAAALGEMWQGSGKGYSNVVMLTIGTGIGGGVVVDGKIVAGAFGSGGEIGHMPIVDDEADMCNCGRRGCLEQAASATGMVKEAKKLLLSGAYDSLLSGDTDISAKSICDAAYKGDILALRVMDRAARYLGRALASISSILDPEVYIIGGGVSNAGQLLIDIIEKHYREQVLFLSKDTPIRLAELGNDAGIYGCARSVSEDLCKRQNK
jgi:glucokinase